MKRRGFVLLLAGAMTAAPSLGAQQEARSRQAAKIVAIGMTLLLLVAPAAAEAEQPSKVYRLGFLTGAGQGVSVVNQAFRDQLRTLGYIEGRNLVFEYRSAEGHPERFPSLAEELVRTEPDVIVGHRRRRQPKFSVFHGLSRSCSRSPLIPLDQGWQPRWRDPPGMPPAFRS